MAKNEDYPVDQRDFDVEDVQHLDDLRVLILDATSATALPGLESVRDQIAIRVGMETKFDDEE